jgi:predicted anti-sigma-YlaC factor YlaD
MDCAQIQEFLSHWMDGELHPSAEPEVFAHLSRCFSCRAFFRDLSTLNHEFTAIRSQAVPVSLDRRVLNSSPTVQASARSLPWFSTGRTYSFRAVSMAVLFSVILTGTVSSFFYHSQPQQTIVCLTPLPEVEVNGYVVVAPTSAKGIN